MNAKEIAEMGMKLCPHLDCVMVSGDFEEEEDLFTGEFLPVSITTNYNEFGEEESVEVVLKKKELKEELKKFLLKRKKKE